MADSTWSDVVERIEEMVVNYTDESIGDVKIAQVANPVNWSKFGKVLIGTLVSIWVVGVGAIQQAFATLWSAPWNAGASFLEDLIDTAVGGATDTLAIAAKTTSTSVESWETFAFTFAVAAVIAGLYLASLGVKRLG